MMNIAFKYIPLGMVSSQSLASHRINFVKQNMTKSCHVHSNSQTSCTSKQFNRGVITQRSNVKFFVPMGIKHHSNGFNIHEILHIETVFTVFVLMVRIHAAFTPSLCSGE